MFILFPFLNVLDFCEATAKVICSFVLFVANAM